MLLYTLGKLCELGRISGRFSAKILECDRWESYRLLSENGFTVIDYPDEKLEREGKVEDVWCTLSSSSTDNDVQVYIYEKL